MTPLRLLVLATLLSLPARGFAQSADPALEHDAAALQEYYDGSATSGGNNVTTVYVPKAPDEGKKAPEFTPAAPKTGLDGTVPPAGGGKPAQEPPLLEIPDSDWKQVGSVGGGESTGDSNPSGREKQDFWEKLRNRSFWQGTFDQICKDAQIPVDYDLNVGDVMHVKPGFKRYLHQAPDGGMLVVDEAKLNLSMGKGIEVVKADGLSPLPIGFGVGANISGTSFIVRRLPEPKACKDLLKLINFTDIKFIYPLHANRFKAMAPDEIWQMPLTLTASMSLGGGMPLDTAGVTTLNIAFGYSRTGASNVTLRRMDLDDPEHPGTKKKTLRVRIRIDYARVTGPSASINASLPASMFGQFRDNSEEFFSNIIGNGADNLVGKGRVSNAVSGLIVGQVKRWLNEYFTGNVNWMAQWVKEDHALIEFILDPEDDAQMKGLEELLAGGQLKVLNTLTKRLSVTGEALLHKQDLNHTIAGWKEKYAEALEGIKKGVKSFTGTDQVERTASAFGFKLPILWNYSRNSEKRHDFITVLDDSGGKFDSFKSRKESSNGFFHLPLVGDFKKANEARSVMAFSYGEKDGLIVAPTLVFVHQQGYINKGEEDARELAVTAAGVMRLVGVRGRGDNVKAGLPLDTVFPKQDADFRRGLGAFTLVVSEKGVTQIVSAPADDVIRSYLRAMKDDTERKVLSWAVANAKERNGILRCPDPTDAPDWPYKWGGQEQRNDADGYASGIRSKFNFAIRLARQLHDIKEMRPADSTDLESARRQSEALKNVIAGSLGNAVTYEDMMRILVQLAEPNQVTAEFIVDANAKTKGAKSVSGRYLYNRGLNEDPTLKKLYETAAKFNPPSTFTD